MNFDEHNNEYFELLNQKLEQSYCINFDDTGYTENEWIARFGDLSLEDAASEYAKKYDLASLKDILLGTQGIS